MAEKYSSDLFRVVIAQISQTIGYSYTFSSPLELLQDIMKKFVQEFAQDLHCNMEHANRLEPDLKDARQSLKNLHMNIYEILDYIVNVEPVVSNRDIGQFPIKRLSNMNFLKAGNTETLTRPVHIFEYLPAIETPSEILPSKELQTHETILKNDSRTAIFDENLNLNSNEAHSSDVVVFFPNNYGDFDNGSSLREMSSVVMTTGGFLSPAIEGKLPEAFVPDIIEKYMGLDAPPASLFVASSSESSRKPNTLFNESLLFLREINTNQQMSAYETFGHKSIIANAVNNDLLLSSISNELNSISSKKSKRQRNDFMKDKKIVHDKTLEKTNNKTIKVQHKNIKSHNEFKICELFHSKKSKKRESNNLQLEKLMKKQARLKKKKMKCQFPVFLEKSETNIDSSTNASETFSLSVVATAPLTIEKEEKISLVRDETSNLSMNSTEVFEVQKIESHQPQSILSIKKSLGETERNKLDVFKKISKPRATRKDGIETSAVLFGKLTSNSILNLPSGTTITPTPPIEKPSASVKIGIDISTRNTTKPKKRGRKSGGKDHLENSGITTNSWGSLQKKQKSKNVITLPIVTSDQLITTSNQTNIPISTEPLNLCNIEVTSGIVPCIQPKSNNKKDKKKNKTNYLVEANKEICAKPIIEKVSLNDVSGQLKSTIPNPDQFISVPNTLPSNPVYPGTETDTGVVPLLPLLHFPPRPGLIPSGPGLYPGAVSLVGLSSNDNRLTIPPFIRHPVSESFRGQHLSESIGNYPQEHLTSCKTELNLDRNYCNVAPLVPENMKLSENSALNRDVYGLENSCIQDSHKQEKLLSLPTGNLGDPIEVSDESDESMQHRERKLSPIISQTKKLSSMQQQNLSYVSSSDTLKDMDSNNDPDTLSLTTNSEAIFLKKQVKLTLPKVKKNTKDPSTPSLTSFNLSSFIGADKFSLAGGADLIPLSRLDCGLKETKMSSSNEYSGPRPQFNICEARPFLSKISSYDDITITSTGPVPIDVKIRKHHKKLKKLKDGKIKKKKEKKNKYKGKERIEVNKSDRKHKETERKHKKERKDKEIVIPILEEEKNFESGTSINDNGSTSKKLFGAIQKDPNLITALQPSLSTCCTISQNTEPPTNQIPKLTLKLNGQSTPLPILYNEGDSQDIGFVKNSNSLIQTNRECSRDHSPELARFSPLVTGPPKSKQSTSNLGTSIGNSPFNTISSSPSPLITKSSQIPINQLNSVGWASNSNNNLVASSTISASSVLLPQQLMLTPNTVMNNYSSSLPINSCMTDRELTLNAPLQIQENGAPNAQINRPSSYVDAEGNRIWICPACGKVDDGSAMIGCDGCDAWYHWTCVGITIAPKDNDDWYCRICITKQKNQFSDKKKKRNKKK
ncbi:uncharacterized protein Taf3 isoform X2 [Drosophila bipectinata]|uniref:uncharacterized protein Taf3 isoform X2 n=1 Tax=Drosophila bipectinata TaxID=42026 RepID=UPI001C89C881|nr:uncharacterized protein LOC108132079 isoform X2 [Drosophila bipectinata]